MKFGASRFLTRRFDLADFRSQAELFLTCNMFWYRCLVRNDTMAHQGVWRLGLVFGMIDRLGHRDAHPEGVVDEKPYISLAACYHPWTFK